MIKQIFWRGLVFFRLTLPLVTDQLMLDSNNSKNEKSRMSNIQPGIDVICLVFLPTQRKDFSIISSNIDIYSNIM